MLTTPTRWSDRPSVRLTSSQFVANHYGEQHTVWRTPALEEWLDQLTTAREPSICCSARCDDVALLSRSLSRSG
jgi:hypothetical protein